MKKLVFILPFIFLTACSGTTAPLSDTNAPTDFVGLTVERAREKAERDGVPFRVVMEDGTTLPVTMDYVVGRINAEVRRGIVTKYVVEGDENDQPAADDPSAVYDQNSWKTMIPDSCMSFFDGCNNCQRIEGEAEAACTRMYCETYGKPECRDEKEADENAAVPKAEELPIGNVLTEAQARTIAEASCVKGGEALSDGSYNFNSKTWWFDANLNSVREGCNPACVVSEETKTAEINWRCTGLLSPTQPK
jgi:hypothetical protein